MKLKIKGYIATISIVATVMLTACGGGSGGGNTDDQDEVVNFNQSVVDLAANGSTMTFDGKVYDVDNLPIELSDYMWEVEEDDLDQTDLDDVFLD